MSVKRQATTDLNHENWDQDDPAEQEEEAGGFKMASKEVLEKRVIRTAKRRSQATGDEPKKSVFSGFSGFNKSPPASFDFLAKLTNGKTASNVSPPKSDTLAISNSFNAVTTSSLSTGTASLARTSTPIAKSAFGKPMNESSLFGVSTTASGFGQSVFTTTKPNTAATESPFKIQSTQSPNLNVTTSKSNTSAEKPATPLSTNIFGSSAASGSANNTKSLFASTNTSSPFKAQTASNSQPSEENKSTNKSDVQEDKKLKYYSKLKGLNESVSAWIKKHVEETPLCILTPIFKDYDKHLKEIQEEYEKSKKDTKPDDDKPTISEKSSDNKTTSPWAATTSSSVFQTSNVFSNNKGSTTTPEKTPNLTMGMKPPTNLATSNFSTTSPPSSGFSFGIKPTSANTSPFGLNTTTTTNANGNSPFSFGIGKPFSFNSNIQKNEEPAKQSEENEDEPPKVEYKPIVEENCVYEKKCKIFVKKDGNFVDKGVGTLYVKKIEDSGKHQLLVRANTSLGNVLLNLILGLSLPTQRMGKNNVMMVCIPTPDSKPPPTSILIRVKTSEEADELLETLNKYKS